MRRALTRAGGYNPRSIGADMFQAPSTTCPAGYHYEPDQAGPITGLSAIAACVPDTTTTTTTTTTPATPTTTTPQTTTPATTCDPPWPWWWLVVAAGIGVAGGMYAQRHQKMLKRNAGRALRHHATRAAGRIVNDAGAAAMSRLI